VGPAPRVAMLALWSTKNDEGEFASPRDRVASIIAGGRGDSAKRVGGVGLGTATPSTLGGEFGGSTGGRACQYHGSSC
jgi:hypothetical protein